MVAQSGSAAERTLVLKEHLNQKWGRELVSYPFEAPSGQCEPKAVSLAGPNGPLAVQLAKVELLLGERTYDLPVPASEVFGPLVGAKFGNGPWDGGSRLYGDAKVKSWSAKLTDSGPVFARVEVTGVIKAGDNLLEIEVVNRWANRLIGDKQPADANVRTVDCPPGFLGGQKLKAGRYTFSTHDPYNQQSPLVSSGLLGPVTLKTEPGPN